MCEVPNSMNRVEDPEPMPELEPCPFCGGEAKRNDDKQNWGDIFCTGCGCHMMTGHMGTAIEAWNTRPYQAILNTILTATKTAPLSEMTEIAQRQGEYEQE